MFSVSVDYDNDGDKDLFITSHTNGNRLFKKTNNGLVNVTVASGFVEENFNTYGASWGDFNNDGCLDVYISNRNEAQSFITNLFYKNNCDGTFTEVTNDVGLSNAPALSFCSGFFDFNNDGWRRHLRSPGDRPASARARARGRGIRCEGACRDLHRQDDDEDGAHHPIPRDHGRR